MGIPKFLSYKRHREANELKNVAKRVEKEAERIKEILRTPSTDDLLNLEYFSTYELFADRLCCFIQHLENWVRQENASLLTKHVSDPNVRTIQNFRMSVSSDMSTRFTALEITDNNPLSEDTRQRTIVEDLLQQLIDGQYTLSDGNTIKLPKAERLTKHFVGIAEAFKNCDHLSTDMMKSMDSTASFSRPNFP